MTSGHADYVKHLRKTSHKATTKNTNEIPCAICMEVRNNLSTLWHPEAPEQHPVCAPCAKTLLRRTSVVWDGKTDKDNVAPCPLCRGKPQNTLASAIEACIRSLGLENAEERDLVLERFREHRMRQREARTQRHLKETEDSVLFWPEVREILTKTRGAAQAAPAGFVKRVTRSVDGWRVDHMSQEGVASVFWLTDEEVDHPGKPPPVSDRVAWSRRTWAKRIDSCWTDMLEWAHEETHECEIEDLRANLRRLYLVSMLLRSVEADAKLETELGVSLRSVRNWHQAAVMRCPRVLPEPLWDCTLADADRDCVVAFHQCHDLASGDVHVRRDLVPCQPIGL